MPHQCVAALSASIAFDWTGPPSFAPRARKVAERALKTIAFHEDGEKFNVWVAYLNLEATYGQPDPAESVSKLFQRALSYADQKKLYMAMIGICERTDKAELCRQCLKTACKKFSASCKVWLRHITYLMSLGDQDEAKKVLDRALQSMPRRKHVKLLSQVALAEFRLGSAER